MTDLPRSITAIIAALHSLKGSIDEARAHECADDLLLEALRSAGHGAVADAYEELQESVSFWYE